VNSEDLARIIAGVASGDYSLLVAFFVMAVVFGVRKFKSNINSKIWPWVSMVLGTLTVFASSLWTGLDWLPAALNAVLVGVVAGTSSSGLWSMSKPVGSKLAEKLQIAQEKGKMTSQEEEKPPENE